jgi:hypothetical protein
VIRLVRAELLKLATTRLFLWLGLMILGLSAFVTSTRIASTSQLQLSGVSEQRSIVQFAAIGAIVALIVGIVDSAGEYAHGTIAHTFLVTPVRERVVAAKLIAGAIAGMLVAAFAEVVTWSIAAVWLERKSVPLQLATRTVLDTYLGILGAGALAAVVGVGIGALFRRQTAAIVLALIWLLVGEPVLSIAGVRSTRRATRSRRWPPPVMLEQRAAPLLAGSPRRARLRRGVRRCRRGRSRPIRRQLDAKKRTLVRVLRGR